MDKFNILINFLEKIQLGVGILAVALIGVIIPMQVFCRYVLNTPLMWPEDIGIGLMVWLGFLGAAILYKRNEHVTVEFFKNYFPKKLSYAISFTIDIVICFLIILIIIYAYHLNKIQMMTIQVGTGIPRGFFYSLPLLVNMITMFIYNFHAILKRILTMADN